MINYTSIFKDFSFVDDVFIERCRAFYAILIEENSHTNLTRITDENEFFIKHIYDSLLILKYKPELITRKGLEIADLGCGAGVPSVILAIALPQANITAIDSIGKKTNFVQKAANKLELSNLKVITGRGRELARKPECNNAFDLLTARAVAELNKLYREVKGMLKPNSSMIFYKTPDAAQSEIASLNNASAKLNWQISETFLLPENMGERCFVYANL